MFYNYNRLWKPYYQEIKRFTRAMDTICDACRMLEKKMIHLGNTMDELTKAELKCVEIFERAQGCAETRTEREAGILTTYALPSFA